MVAAAVVARVKSVFVRLPASASVSASGSVLQAVQVQQRGKTFGTLFGFGLG